MHKELSEALKASVWPRCDELANELALYGTSAIEALEHAASSKTHHVRSASLRALATINEESAKALATRLLKDRAFEVRETAMKVLGMTLPQEVRRGYRLRKKKTFGE